MLVMNQNDKELEIEKKKIKKSSHHDTHLPKRNSFSNMSRHRFLEHSKSRKILLDDEELKKQREAMGRFKQATPPKHIRSHHLARCRNEI